ncbi:META domain-containing protein [Piscinibacter sp. HJYY11]|uniref:META domain-containing protein n=1 Tax=Piscinibacter sp. HJYY11 TaxID=2801333 RepID=UPI00191CC51D|nr:META domain-containing protein [Piscinibacter sp. HJYY11]MBL0728891.1 META domain-containing protein [Piscinibacter sp. HJYY11]
MPPSSSSRLALLLCGLLASVTSAPWAAPASASAAGATAFGNVALRDTRWALQTLDGAPVAAAGARGPVQLTLRSTSQHLTGFAGCNTLRGRYTQRGTSIALKPLATTRMACAPEVMEQEARLLQALASIDSYRIEGRQLSLMQADVVKLTFQATPAR